MWGLCNQNSYGKSYPFVCNWIIKCKPQLASEKYCLIYVFKISFNIRRVIVGAFLLRFQTQNNTLETDKNIQLDEFFLLLFFCDFDTVLLQ